MSCAPTNTTITALSTVVREADDDSWVTMFDFKAMAIATIDELVILYLRGSS